MKKRQATALLLSVAMIVTSFGGCAGGDDKGQPEGTGSESAQEEAWWEQTESADGEFLSYADYLKLHGDAEEIPEDIRVEIPGGYFSARKIRRHMSQATWAGTTACTGMRPAAASPGSLRRRRRGIITLP